MANAWVVSWEPTNGGGGFYASFSEKDARAVFSEHEQLVGTNGYEHHRVMLGNYEFPSCTRADLVSLFEDDQMNDWPWYETWDEIDASGTYHTVFDLTKGCVACGGPIWKCDCGGEGDC